jgi:hypothetical protein
VRGEETAVLVVVLKVARHEHGGEDGTPASSCTRISPSMTALLTNSWR